MSDKEADQVPVSSPAPAVIPPSEPEAPTATDDAAPVDLGGLGVLDLTPSWAKAKPEDGLKRYHSDRYTGEREEPRGGDRGRRPSFGGPRPGSGPRSSFGGPRPGSGSRPSFDAPRPGNNGPRPFGGAPRKPFDRDARGPRRDDRRQSAAPRFGDYREAPPPLDVEVRVLPEQKALGSVIRKIQTACRAFPLRDLAYLFLDNPASVLLRVAPKKAPARKAAGSAVPDADPVALFQCKACGLPALSEEDLLSHIVSRHLADYYDAETVDCEAPKGSFSCVAKCGLSGELIGPPNLHGFNAKIQEMLRSKYPSMSEDAYRSRLEMIHDPEVVEQWRQSATKKTIYRRKADAKTVEPVPAASEADAAAPAAPVADDRPVLDRESAELEFRRVVAPTLVTRPKSLVTTAAVGLTSPSSALVSSFRVALAQEKRFPASLFFALRGAFHHRKLVFFRANDPRGPDFVTCVAPSPLDSAHAVPELSGIVQFVADHPGVTLRELVASISGGDSAKQGEVLKNFSLLAEKGHLVAFFNDVLAVPAANPAYRPPRQTSAPKAESRPTAAAPAVAPAAASVAAPAAAVPTAPAGE